VHVKSQEAHFLLYAC